MLGQGKPSVDGGGWAPCVGGGLPVQVGLRPLLSYSVPPVFWKCSLLHLINEMQFISSVRICIDFYGGNVTRWGSLSV